MSVSIRRARPDDVDFLVELTMHEDVDPYLSARRATTREEILEEVERSEADPHRFGRFVIEVDGERAGVMGFRVENERSRIAWLGGLAVHPDHRGRHLADEAAHQLQRHLIFDLDYHRLQLEIYAFNERAIRHAERAGFTREGIRRKAYWRHGEWVDGVMYGLVREDLEQSVEPARLRVEALDHLVLTVRDIEATTAFYARLGFEPRELDDGRRALHFGRQKLNLHRAGEELAPHAQRPTPGSADLCFLTSLPPDAVVDELARSQIAVELGPVTRTGATATLTSVYVRDPDGNLVEIASPAAP